MTLSKEVQSRLDEIDKAIESAFTRGQLLQIGNQIKQEIESGEEWTKNELEVKITRTLWHMQWRSLGFAA